MEADDSNMIHSEPCLILQTKPRADFNFDKNRPGEDKSRIIKINHAPKG